ncbi:hypothetical protein CHS0354_028023 [Potamilus streckersoni]|uniref:LisH domain-containing protein n=1 Tax=Potamilus streckersoni TaxID=2493646 RepID=A0AAE0TJ89_9BIVA|nr:hypothetical protein CHS0354_028023 [Potamilus streckersoni]
MNMKEEDEEYMSATDLRNRLYHSLRDRGLVNSMKSQLRSSLVAELKQSLQGKLTLTDLRVPEDGSLLHRAANSLVADHLKRCKYDYTYSVFLPESGIGEGKLITTKELMELLKISPQSKLYRKLAADSSSARKGFIWQLLSELSAIHSQASMSVCTQTDLIRVSTVTSLDEKLNVLDELFSSRRDEQYRVGAAAVEDRILAFQRQLEERFRTELKLQVAKTKDDEVKRIQIEERENCRRELEQARRELERTYQSKFDALVTRERNTTEKLQREQEIQEKEIYNQRQSILEEIEAVHMREAQVKREAEVNQREQIVEKERLKAKEEEIKRRELQVTRMEVEFEQRLHNEMTKFKVEYQASFMERTQNIELREARLRDNEKRVAEDREKIDSLKSDLRDKTARVNELETLLQEARHMEVSATKHNEFLNAKLRDMADYATLKEQNAVYRSQLETLRMRMSELIQTHEREKNKQEELLRDLHRAGGESLYSDMKSHPTVRQERLLMESDRMQLHQKYEEEMSRNKILLQKFEEQTYQMKEMNRELLDTRQQLVSTQLALSNEVYRKPHGEDHSRLSFNLSHKSKNSAAFIDDDSNEGRGNPLRSSLSRSKKKKISTLEYDGKDVYNDVDLSAAHPAMSVKLSTDFSDDSVSSTASADVIASTKYRLKSLEKEARNLEKAYADFQHHLTNPSALPPESGPSASHKSQHSGSIRSGKARSTQSPEASPIARPMSSTPYQHKRSSRDVSDDSLTELQKPSSVRQELTSATPMPRFDLSNMSDDEGHTSRTHEDQRIERSRPITMSDLEARPGSPSIVVLHGEGSSTDGPSAQDPDNIKPQKAVPEPQVSYPTKLPPLSLDSAWKSQTVGLDSAWKQKKEEEEEETGKKVWEEERRRKEEERRRKEQEDWEREQEELRRLQDKGEDEVDVRRAGQDEEETKEEDIDPVMKQYMAMVQQQKAQEQQQTQKQKQKKKQEERTPSHTENELSITEETKSDEMGDEFEDW